MTVETEKNGKLMHIILLGLRFQHGKLGQGKARRRLHDAATSRAVRKTPIALIPGFVQLAAPRCLSWLRKLRTAVAAA
jgi:hypothetical protein